ncbi:MAG: TonB-dependent receptor [Gammaproteobacteria bacterium]|nr:TonB-dependent receptor [Gammaproteobacteria bacterium]MDE0366076.1 TonB-dependent receptor [Gammaproteobacteria bacterium]
MAGREALARVASIAFGVCIAQGVAVGDASAEQAAAPEAQVIDEIIVTGTKRAESLQEVGVAITALDFDEFSSIGLTSIVDILDYAPGAAVTSDGTRGGGEINMRGVNNEGGSSIVSVYIDDIPITSSIAGSLGNLFTFDNLLGDIERIEVIKGPQGTLYGANSVGGVIRYVTGDPSTGGLTGRVGGDFSTVAHGDFSHEFSGFASMPLVEDKLGVSVSGFYSDRAGFIDRANGDEDVNDSESYGLRGAARINFSDKVSLDLSALYTENEYDDRGAIELVPLGPMQGEPLSGDYTTVIGSSPSSLEYEVYAAALNADLDWATLTVSGGRSDFTAVSVLDLGGAIGFIDLIFPGTAPHASATNTASNGFEKWVTEVRLTSPVSEVFEWLIGFYYTDEASHNNQEIAVVPDPGAVVGIFDFPADYEEVSVFANLTWYITPDFDLSFGMRHASADLAFDTLQDGALAGGRTEFVDDDKDSRETYSAGMRYRPNDATAFYVRAASGYRPPYLTLPVDLTPLFGPGAKADALVDADSMWSYELGAKGSLMEGVLSYDLAFWMVDWKDFQADRVVVFFPTTDNAVANMDAQGVEATLSLRPADGLRIRSSLTWTDSEVDGDDPTLGLVDGESVRYIPEWTLSILGNYDFALTPEIGAHVGAGLRHHSGWDNEWGAAALGGLNVPTGKTTIVDVNLGVTLGGRYRVNLYATNLFDEYEYSRTRNNGFSVFAPLIRPRTVGINVSVDF